MSTVLAVILILAMTVTLAATAGFLIFDTAESPNEPAPNVAITTTYDDRTDGDGQSLTVEFTGGNTLEAADVSFELEGAVAVDRTTGTESTADIDGDQIDAQLGTEIVTGESIVFDATTTTTGAGEYLDLGDATLRLVWNPDDESVDHSEVLWTWSP